jgi:hypothetical protein
MGLSESNSIPERLGSKIDYKILVVIFCLGIAFHVVNNAIKDITEEFNVIDIVELTIQAVVMTSSFIVAKLYWPSKIFGKAYLALGIAFGLWFVAEIMWQIYENVLFIEPYPSYADIFYFAFYPLALYHLITNIRGFDAKITKKTITWIAIIPIFILTMYSYLAITEWGGANFDYYYSLIFVSIASVSASFALFGAQMFRHGAFAVVWSLLAVGIFLHVFGDMWYYYLEIFGQYEDTHVVNVFWPVGGMIIIYALYKHQKIF